MRMLGINPRELRRRDSGLTLHQAQLLAHELYRRRLEELGFEF